MPSLVGSEMCIRDSLYTVSKLLGHTSVRMTQVYAKIINQKKDEAVNLVNGLFD